MRTTKMHISEYKKINEFPKVKKEPHNNEVWIASFPYETLGNMEKLRPILITEVKEESVKCKMITTNPKFAKKIKGTLTKGKPYNRESYLKDNEVEIPIYKLYGKLKHKIELEEE